MNRLTTSFFLIALVSPLAAFADKEPLIIGAFSSQSTQQVFKQWQPYGFDKVKEKTIYDHVNHQGMRVIKAESNRSASGLTKKVHIDLNKYPIVVWRWKVASTPQNASDHTRSGDDHAARLYIIFETPDKNLLSWVKQTMGLPNTHAINYIWANEMDVGAHQANPFTNQSVMLAVNSGQNKVGEWVMHERNVLKDYKKLFGRPPPSVSAIAIMSDTDNGYGQVTAYYGDITFKPSQ